MDTLIGASDCTDGDGPGRLLKGIKSGGGGRWSIRGRWGIATVDAQAAWAVRDRCDGSTRLRANEGTVEVIDFTTGETLTLQVGETHDAHPAG